jgi:hypothetical protein
MENRGRKPSRLKSIIEFVKVKTSLLERNAATFCVDALVFPKSAWTAGGVLRDRMTIQEWFTLSLQKP